MRSRSGAESAGAPVSGKFSPLAVVTWPLLRTHVIALIVLPIAIFGFTVGTSGSIPGRISAVLASTALLLGYGLLVIATVRRRSTALETATVEDGVVIHGLRSAATMLIAMLIAMLLCATGFPIAFAMGVLRDGMEAGSASMFAISLIVAVMLIPVVAMLFLRRFRMNRLVLMHSTITYVGYRTTRAAAWISWTGSRFVKRHASTSPSVARARSSLSHSASWPQDLSRSPSISTTWCVTPRVGPARP